MDWGTHVVLAAKLLESCSLDKGAAIYSNLPAIDNKPAHYHRVYAHILENLPSILDVALEIFGSEEVTSRDFDALARRMQAKVDSLKKDLERVSGYEERSRLESKIYAYTRLTEEAETFVELANKASDLFGDNDISKISSDKMSAAVSLISHIYFDTFNNPVQVFLPYSSVPSGQWDFWDNIDYMRFRGEFYNDDNINLFRQEIAKSKSWETKLTPPALIKAMIIRIGELSQPSIKYEVIDWSIRVFLRYMNINQYYRTDIELEFCRNIEADITKLIMAKFSKKEQGK